jgi:hypothetical protein
MIKAELGDYLYYIIFAIVMIIGIVDKMQKAKRQQQSNTPRIPQPDNDFEDIDGQQQPSQTVEEFVRRMMQTVETQEAKTPYREPEPSPEVFQRNYYQPIVCTNNIQSEEELFTPAGEEETVTGGNYDFAFDVRQAVIANEILNRKY